MNNDLLNKIEITSFLKTKEKVDICVLKEVDSTNNYLKREAKSGIKQCKVLIAESQTAGRGRLERRFYSPENSGIYMSILCFPKLDAKLSVLITALTAVAVSDAVFLLTGKLPKIKWVNDLILNKKKLCGILTEGAIKPNSAELEWAVVGIGINIYPPKDGFNKEIEQIATYLLDDKKENLKNRLIAEILNRFFDLLEDLEEKSFIEAYKERSFVLNKEINVIKADGVKKATALDIDQNCRLLVEYENKEKEYLSSGEISIKF